jgi:hypothetical protein
MHFQFSFTAVQILWTLTLAALLVLLTVLVGRDRARHFPFFTASIVLVTIRLTADRLLYGHIAQIPMSLVFFTLADLAVLLELLVLIEVARRAFRGASRSAAAVTAVTLIAVAAGVIAAWGPWPAWKTVTVSTVLARVRLMQLISHQGDTFCAVLAIELGILVVFFGRRFGAGWRSHVQRIAIGLSAAAIGALATRALLQAIFSHVTFQSQQQVNRLMGLQSHLSDASGAIYFGVLVWWIACLWMDEPGEHAGAANRESQPATLNLSA